jgi:hypothetical protein
VAVRRLVLAPRGLTGLLNPLSIWHKTISAVFMDCFNCASSPAAGRDPSLSVICALGQHRGRLASSSFASVAHQRLVLQAGDFVLYQQLATLQLHDLEMVDRRTSAGFDYFRFQGSMLSFQFRKMRCYGHIGGLPSQIVGWSLAGGSGAFGR